ncbi:choline dehydrogenase [Truncatella angustata]|uniref:Choline dehydrogenase n=1 Tax=Truncatella angustata TaxID=152316 RepID=A0A9P8ZXL6_9PEZI|nr:choline dehydrogenase [Truncatella angustata]KAH6653104.1 choline dehydrogenase [Truncatella angustata]
MVRSHLLDAILASATLVSSCYGSCSYSTKSSTNGTVSQYDYVIVGGGLTGLVVATRLTEDPDVSVLVLEYGAEDRSNLTKIPYYGTTLNTASLRSLISAPEPQAGNQTFAVRVSQVPGGGSQVNGMAWNYGSSGDYDGWEALGNPGWGWDSISSYIRKDVQFTVPKPEIEALYEYSYNTSAYATEAYAQSSYPEFQYPDLYKYIDGLDELGTIPFVEEHAEGHSGGGRYFVPTALDPTTMTRASAFYAYYDKVSNRTNLKLLQKHQVREIVFSDSPEGDLVASGVKALNRSTNNTVTFTAKKEIILAAGAIYTPQLLQWSGIGPKSVLEASGIEAKLDFPAVGSNFQDHAVAYWTWTLGNPTFPAASDLTSNATFWNEAVDLYHNNLTGPLTKAQANYIAFPALPVIADDSDALVADLLAQTEGAYLPDIYASSPELLAGYEAQKKLLAAQHGNGSVAAVEIPISGAGGMPNAVEKPLSRGTIHLNASDVYGEPVVFYNALSNPFDRAILFRSLEYTRKLQATSAVADLEPVELWPGVAATTEEAALAALTKVGWLRPSFSHPSSSCPMLPKELGGCVSSDLLFYGIQKLSIIDASILPMVPGSHIQATMYAVAEKASDIIKARA